MSGFNTESFEFIDFVDMTLEMSTKIWECRNLPQIRQWMVTQDPIPYQNHAKFILNLSKDRKRKYYSVLENGDFVGSVNIQYLNSETAERGIYIAPDYWGKKYAKRICKEFYIFIRDNLKIKIITTKVFKANIASNSLEISLGARKIAEDTEFNYYQCNLETF